MPSRGSKKRKLTAFASRCRVSGYAALWIGWALACKDGHFAWDLCNEPFSYSCLPTDIPAIVTAEYRWLEDACRLCTRVDAQAPLPVCPVSRT